MKPSAPHQPANEIDLETFLLTLVNIPVEMKDGRVIIPRAAASENGETIFWLEEAR